MLGSLLSALVIAVGSGDEVGRSTESAAALGIECRVIRPDIGISGRGSRALGPDAYLHELIAAGMDLIETPWALVLVAGESVWSHPPLLEACLQEATGGLEPIDLTGSADQAIPDPLHLPGARIVASTWRPEGKPLTWGAALLPRSDPGPYAVEGERGPFRLGSPASDWALAVANRRMWERGEEAAAGREALMDAGLLAWGGEFDGALSIVRSCTTADDREGAVAGRIRTVSGIATGRDAEVTAGLAQWTEFDSESPDLAAWKLLITELAGELPEASVVERIRSTPAISMGSWCSTALAGRVESRRRRWEFTLNLYFGYLNLWTRTSFPNELTRAHLSNEIVSLWTRMRRDPGELVDRWPAGAASILGGFLATGNQGEIKSWLALARAFVERYPGGPELFRRVQSAATEMSMSDALMWTLRSAASGYGDMSPLRERARSPKVGPTDRVLAAGLALHHARDATAEPLLVAAASQCASSDLPELVVGLAQTAPNSVPAFVQAASSTEERTRLIDAAVRQLKLAPSGLQAPRNRAQSRAQKRNR